MKFRDLSAVVLISLLGFSAVSNAGPNLIVDLVCTGSKSIFQFERLQSADATILGHMIDIKKKVTIPVIVRPLKEAAEGSQFSIGWFLPLGRRLAVIHARSDGKITGEIVGEEVICVRRNTGR